MSARAARMDGCMCARECAVLLYVPAWLLKTNK